MAGVEIATAYVSLVPSTRGLGRQLVKDVEQAGTQGGRGFASNLLSNAASGLNRVGDRIVSTVTTAGKLAGIGAAAAMGSALWGGLGRVLDTEDAQKMFGQLGLSVRDTDRLMGNLQTTFETGPFAYPDVYDISSQLLASGVGMDRLVSSTEAVGNMAAFAGADLADVGRITQVIAAQGKVSASELNRMADAGIPIRQILADGLGVTVEEMLGLVSAGELSSDMFFDLIGEASQFDGAMTNFASTTRGAWTVMKAGIAGIGEALLAPWFGEDGDMATFLGQINSLIFGSVQPAVTAFAGSLRARLLPAIKDVAGWLKDRLIPAVEDAVGWLQDHSDTILDIAKSVGTAVGGLAGLAVGFNLVSRAISATPIGLVIGLASALVYAYQNSETFRNIVNQAFQTVSRVVGPIIEGIIGFVSRLGGMFSGSEPGSPATAVEGLRARISSAFESIRTIVQGVLDAIKIGFDILAAAWDRFGDSILRMAQAAWDGILAVIDGALQMIAGVVDVVLGLITLDFGRMKDGVVAIVNGLKTVVAGIFEALAGIISGVVDGIRNAVSAAFNTIKDRIVELIGAAVDRVKALFDGMITFIGGIPGRIADIASTMFTSVKDAMTAAKDWAIDRLNDILDFVSHLPDRISSLVSGVKGRLVQPFKDAANEIKGILDGIGRSFKLPSLSMPVIKMPSLPGIPRGHDGGVVPGRPGQEVLALLMAGETVLPTHKASVYDMPPIGGNDELLAEVRALRVEVKRSREQGLRLARTS